MSRERCWQLKRLSSAAAGPPVWLWSMGVYAAHMLTRYVVCCCTCTSTPGRAGHASSSLPGVIPDASHLYAGNGPAALAIAQTDGPADEPGDEAQPSTDPVPGGPHPQALYSCSTQRSALPSETAPDGLPGSQRQCCRITRRQIEAFAGFLQHVHAWWHQQICPGPADSVGVPQARRRASTKARGIAASTSTSPAARRARPAKLRPTCRRRLQPRHARARSPHRRQRSPSRAPPRPSG